MVSLAYSATIATNHSFRSKQERTSLTQPTSKSARGIVRRRLGRIAGIPLQAASQAVDLGRRVVEVEAIRWTIHLVNGRVVPGGIVGVALQVEIGQTANGFAIVELDGCVVEEKRYSGLHSGEDRISHAGTRMVRCEVEIILVGVACCDDGLEHEARKIRYRRSADAEAESPGHDEAHRDKGLELHGARLMSGVRSEKVGERVKWDEVRGQRQDEQRYGFRCNDGNLVAEEIAQ